MSAPIMYFDEIQEFTKDHADLLKKYSKEKSKQFVFSTKPSSNSLLKGFDYFTNQP